ncbi:hypothetical protein [Prevotella micans]|uniref:hypothetical protein n=1 Tax=Prevotella micans TaxID=189723 RepID=UPI000377CCD4|nr:hypothetical protein [Prevotella micans]
MANITVLTDKKKVERPKRNCKSLCGLKSFLHLHPSPLNPAKTGALAAIFYIMEQYKYPKQHAK